MEIEFLEESHTYLCNGIIVPSVSDILNFLFPDKYSNIPKCILSAKADFGSHIHEAIEKYEKCEDVELTPMEEIVFEQYLELKEEYEIEPIEQESLVHFEDRYCGRLDMIANIKGVHSLVDIKTTSKLDEESLSYQLGYYAMAYGEDFEKYYCLWLRRKELGQLVEIKPKSKEELLKVLEEFERGR